MSYVTKFLQSRYAVMALLIVGALICYAIGYRKGSVIALLLGVGFEIAMWIRVARWPGRGTDRR